MSIGILSIATNSYLDYWIDMATSFESNVRDPEKHTLYVFTDEVEKATDYSRNHPQLNIQVIRVASMGFPEATLLRYEIYNKFKDHLSNEVLMHLDADMLIHDSKFLELESLAISNPEGVVLVSHPGYWRPVGFKSVLLSLLHPKLIVRDLYIWLKLGGLGSWETNLNSLAYVPRSMRKNYVCGGIWVGRNSTFKALCRDLSESTRKDLDIGRVPIWHDESFINMWASKNKYTLLSPSFCFEPTYPQLASLENIVEAVDKNAL